MPFAQWGYPHVPGSRALFESRFPADFISEAIDQTRGWFYTLLAISTMLFGGNGSRGPGGETLSRNFPHPFRNCIVLGLVGGEDGKKLSKSKRNYKEPTYIFDREGADAMRWSMLSSQAPWTGARFKEDTIATDQREFLIKLYNVYSFFVIYANIDRWSPGDGSPRGAPSKLDRWILAELNQTLTDVIAAMDGYENYPACRRLVDFVDALSNWYVRRSRDRFWRAGMDDDKRAAYHTLWTCLGELSKIIAPFVPFFAESLYQNLLHSQLPGSPESVHLCDYPAPRAAAIDRRLLDEMALVREIASLGRSARMDAKIKVRQPLPVVEIVLADPSHQSWLDEDLPLIADELNVKRIDFASEADRYVSYEVKPNFKTIGPKFGKLAPRIKEALAAADGGALRRHLDQSGKAAITVDGQSVELAGEDVQVTLKAKPGWAAAQGPQVVVVLSTEVTDDLKAEGIARDVVHLIQTARKDDQLDYQDRIKVRMDTEGAVAAAVLAHADYIKGEVLAVELAIDKSVLDPPHGGEIDGTAVRFAIEVVR
jgi:isoleucyl-tRNA synthetase